MKKLSPEEYYKTLPRKYISCAGLFLNSNDQVLLVNPTYKDHWEIPGGIAELDESPQDAYKREIKEELSLSLNPNQLLVIDYRQRKGITGDGLMLVFFGGVLSDKQISDIKLQADELKEFRFFDVEETKNYLNERMSRRIPKAFEAYKTGKCFALVEGYEV